MPTLEERRLLDYIGWLTGCYLVPNTPLVEGATPQYVGVQSQFSRRMKIPCAEFQNKVVAYADKGVTMFELTRYNLSSTVKSFKDTLKNELNLDAYQVGKRVFVADESVALGDTFRFTDPDNDTHIWIRKCSARRHNGMFKPAPRATRLFGVEANYYLASNTEELTLGSISLFAEGLSHHETINYNILNEAERERLAQGDVSDDELLALYGYRNHTNPYDRTRTDADKTMSALVTSWSTKVLESEFGGL